MDSCNVCGEAFGVFFPWFFSFLMSPRTVVVRTVCAPHVLALWHPLAAAEPWCAAWAFWELCDLTRRCNRAAAHRMALRQGGCVPWSREMPQPNASQGATAHARSWPATRAAVVRCQQGGLCRTSLVQEQCARPAASDTRVTEAACRRVYASLAVPCAPQRRLQHRSGLLQPPVAPYDSDSRCGPGTGTPAPRRAALTTSRRLQAGGTLLHGEENARED